MKIKDHIHPVIDYPLHKICDRIDIIIAAVFWFNSIDSKPALLIEWNPDNINIPILHVLNHVVIIGSIEYSVSAHAGKLCT